MCSILVGELDDLVFDRRAVARPGAVDPARVHRALVQVRADELVDARVRGRQPAQRLALREDARPKRKRDGRIVARLRRAGVGVDRVAMDARRRARLETPSDEPQPGESSPRAPSRPLADAPAAVCRAPVCMRPFRNVPVVTTTACARDAAAVAADDARRRGRPRASGPPPCPRGASGSRSLRAAARGRASRRAPGRTARRGPHTAGPRQRLRIRNWMPAVGEPAHHAAERVDLAHQLALGEAADRGVAGHAPDRGAGTPSEAPSCAPCGPRHARPRCPRARRRRRGPRIPRADCLPRSDGRAC